MAEAQECSAHDWRPLAEDALTALRTRARAGRPPGAWVESAERCARCGSVEAAVSWFGQLHRVAVLPDASGAPATVRWPIRARAPGGATGMG